MLPTHLFEQSHLEFIIVRRHIEIVAVRILKSLLLRPDLLSELTAHVCANLLQGRQILDTLSISDIETAQVHRRPALEKAIFPWLMRINIAERLREVDLFALHGNHVRDRLAVMIIDTVDILQSGIRQFLDVLRHLDARLKNAVLLVDTYDVLHSGIPNAIRIAHEVLAPQGHRLAGVRVDSGDLAYLSKRIRKMLDKAGLEDCKIILSNSLDEFTISSLLLQGARVDSFGVGERLITAKSDPVFGAVYKLVAVEENGIFQPRIKMSENVEKLTNPGLKDLYRIYDRHGKAVADMIAVQGEPVDLTQPFRYVDPRKPWKNRFFEGGSAVNLRRLYVRDGERVEELPPLEEIRAYVRRQLAEEIWPEEQRFENPHRHYLDTTPNYYELKMGLLEEVRGKHS